VAAGIHEIQQFCERVIANIERVIVGKRDVLEMVLVALLCEGHILFEDVPGTGKTMLARATAISIGGQFKRIQFTPDLLPNDVTGGSVYNQRTREVEVPPGPAFVNALPAGESNRPTPRTPWGLLGCHGQRQITVDGETRVLPRPFLVMATQNPIEYEGTFPLPEAQLDRFFMRLRMGYPSFEDEATMLVNLRGQHPIETLQPVERAERIVELAPLVWQVHVNDTVRDYALRLVRATREHPDLALGASPRGSLALVRAAQAWAAMHGRDYVLPDDVKRMALPTLAHRLILRAESQLRGRTAEDIIRAVLEQTPVPLVEEPARR